MGSNLGTPLRRFLTVAFWEGISYLVLLLVAMPLKYAFDMPMAVRVVGSLHGVLFVAYMLTLAVAFFGKQISFGMSVVAVIVSFIPGGTFWLDAKLKQPDRSNAQPPG